MRSGVNSVSPLVVGIVVGGLLLFAVVGIVRNVTAAEPGANIQTAVAAGVASVQQAPMQSNVSNALPAFSLQPETQPVPQPLPTLPPVVFQSPEQIAAFDNPSWLSVAYGPNGEKVVWGGAWFSCQHIDVHALTFASIRTDPALAIWGGLAPARQNDVAKECQKP